MPGDVKRWPVSQSGKWLVVEHEATLDQSPAERTDVWDAGTSHVGDAHHAHAVAARSQRHRGRAKHADLAQLTLRDRRVLPHSALLLRCNLSRDQGLLRWGAAEQLVKLRIGIRDIGTTIEVGIRLHRDVKLWLMHYSFVVFGK